MVQQLLVGVIFLGAIAFLVNLVLRALRAKERCASGCGKCAEAASALKPRP